MVSRLPLVLASGFVLAACNLGEVDLTGKECPCAQGWVCDRSVNECVRALDAGPDAGPDAGIDAGPRDAGEDGGPLDAGEDSGPADAGPPCAILMVIDPAADPTGDPDVVARLETEFDCGVRTVADSEATIGDAAGSDLIIISSTTRSSIIGGLYRSVPQPVINWEPYVYPDMGMSDTSPGNDFGTVSGATQIIIVDDTHPLAAGQTGTVDWLDTPGSMAYAQPEGEGTLVAEVIDPADGGVPMPGIIAYRAGDDTIAERAAGCRIGLPLGNVSPSRLSDVGWAMFDAAVQWALDGCP